MFSNQITMESVSDYLPTDYFESESKHIYINQTFIFAMQFQLNT